MAPQPSEWQTNTSAPYKAALMTRPWNCSRCQIIPNPWLSRPVPTDRAASKNFACNNSTRGWKDSCWSTRMPKMSKTGQMLISCPSTLMAGKVGWCSPTSITDAALLPPAKRCLQSWAKAPRASQTFCRPHSVDCKMKQSSTNWRHNILWGATRSSKMVASCTENWPGIFCCIADSVAWMSKLEDAMWMRGHEGSIMSALFRSPKLAARTTALLRPRPTPGTASETKEFNSFTTAPKRWTAARPPCRMPSPSKEKKGPSKGPNRILAWSLDREWSSTSQPLPCIPASQACIRTASRQSKSKPWSRSAFNIYVCKPNLRRSCAAVIRPRAMSKASNFPPAWADPEYSSRKVLWASNQQRSKTPSKSET